MIHPPIVYIFCCYLSYNTQTGIVESPVPVHVLLLLKLSIERVIVATESGFISNEVTGPLLNSVIFVATLPDTGQWRKTIDIVLASYCRLFDSVPISTKAISSTNRTNRIVIGKELNLDLPILKCGINVDQSIYHGSPFHFSLLY